MNVDLAVPVTAISFVAIVVALMYRFYRRVPPRRAFVLNRKDSIAHWEAIVSPEQLPRVHAILIATCDVYLFKRTDAWRLRPDDRLKAIYDSIYPPKLGLADTLEGVFMFDALQKEFGVPESEIRHLWKSDPTLADVVACCLKQQERR